MSSSPPDRSPVECRRSNRGHRQRLWTCRSDGEFRHAAHRSVPRAVTTAREHARHSREPADSAISSGFCRIDQPHAIGDKRISVVVGRQRRSRHGPDSLLIFLHRYRLGALTRKLHLYRIGRAEAEGHTAVGVHFGRDQRHWRRWRLRWFVLRRHQDSKHRESTETPTKQR